jgi:hypothetical protein
VQVQVSWTVHNTRPPLQLISEFLVLLWEIKWKLLYSELTVAALNQPPQHSSQQTPHAPNHHQDRSGALERRNSPVRPNDCFNCGELGHYANICTKRNMQTPQKDNGQRIGQPLSQACIGNSTHRGDRSQRNYARGRVNHVTTEQDQDALGVVLGTFSVNSVPATILFDSGASHSFITEQFVAKHDKKPMISMKTHLLISSPNGEMKSTYVCPRVNLKIREIDFQADLVVLT